MDNEKKITGKSEEQKALAKLTRYLDAVENSIAQLLKERAGGLFTSVSKTDNLKTLMKDATLQIQNLKHQNLVSKEKLVEKTLNIETWKVFWKKVLNFPENLTKFFKIL